MLIQDFEFRKGNEYRTLEIYIDDKLMKQVLSAKAESRKASTIKKVSKEICLYIEDLDPDTQFQPLSWDDNFKRTIWTYEGIENHPMTVKLYIEDAD